MTTSNYRTHWLKLIKDTSDLRLLENAWMKARPYKTPVVQPLLSRPERSTQLEVGGDMYSTFSIFRTGNQLNNDHKYKLSGLAMWQRCVYCSVWRIDHFPSYEMEVSWSLITTIWACNSIGSMYDFTVLLWRPLLTQPHKCMASLEHINWTLGYLHGTKYFIKPPKEW